jgi:hypothetical protein
MDLIDELGKKCKVRVEWGKERNEFNELLLSCEGNFPHDDDRIKIKISAPLEDWQMLEMLEAEDYKRILLERFIEPALGLVKELKRREMS